MNAQSAREQVVRFHRTRDHSVILRGDHPDSPSSSRLPH